VTEPEAAEHRQLRELLGAFVLGGLPEDARTTMRAHLDGCPVCRADLADIEPLAADLRGIDADALSDLPVPPADLGERIRLAIAAEQHGRQADGARDERVRRLRGLVAVAAAAAVLALSVAGGVAIGRSSAPTIGALPAPSTSAAPLPVEQVEVRVLDPRVGASEASIIAHTWGVEARFEATGFTAGEVYRAAFRSTDGRVLPAGEFLGTGDSSLRCNMQSALLRQDTEGFVVLDADGSTVLSADL
jgi:anti-sigma factor RsiW